MGRLSWRVFVALVATSFVAAALLGTHGLAYWDAGDYVREAIRGEGSGLLLGRPLFLATSRVVVRLALASGCRATALEPVLRWWWSLVSACAPALLAVLAARLGARRTSAIAVGLALALSPAFAHTAHQVLTDGPALTLTLLALVLATPNARSSIPVSHARALAAGLVLGAAVATRETAIVHALALVFLVRSPSRIALVVLALFASIATALAIGRGVTPSLFLGWVRAMRGSSVAHPLGARDVAMSIAWLFAIGVAPMIAAALAIVRGCRSRLHRPSLRASRVRAIVVPSALASLALVAYPDVSFSPRYFLATAPLVFLVAGPALATLYARRRILAVAAFAIPLIVGRLAARGPDAIAETGDTLARAVADLPGPPDHALVVPGHFCPAIEASLAAESAVASDEARDHVETRSPRSVRLLCTGWSWPSDARALAATLQDARCRGDMIAIDLDDRAWIGPRELAARDDIRAWAHARPSIAIGPWTVVAADDPRGASCRDPLAR